eukprot:10545960-Lingulodinium_polyedra.AAC.1
MRRRGGTSHEKKQTHEDAAAPVTKKYRNTIRRGGASHGQQTLGLARRRGGTSRDVYLHARAGSCVRASMRARAR